jgi:uncharacterized membrane protein
MFVLVLIYASLLLSGAVFGFFYGWSITVMRGLDQTDASAAIAAMQSVNASIMTPWFVLIFFGTPLLLAGSALAAWLAGGGTSASWLLVATLTYLFGCFAVTVAFNVPMNEALGTVDAASVSDPAGIWSAYSGPWTAWNHVRTAACGFSLLATGLGLRAWPA